MRLLSAVLFVALTGSIGFAEEPAPPPAPTDDAKPAEAKPRPARSKVPLRVVKLLPETRQVLLFDKTKGSHVVAEVGQDVEGYLVDDIGDDEVTLVAANGTEVILAAPDPTWRRRGTDRNRAATGAPAKPDRAKTDVATELAPEDPYADAPVAAPITPGADGVRVADATKPAPAVAPGADGVRVASATPTPAAASADIDPGVAAFMAAVAGEDIDENGNPVAKPAPAPTKTPAVAVPATPAAGPTTATIKRADIDAALADFASTSSTFRASFVKDGLRFDDVTKGSLLSRVGLERGDVVTTVDGQPLRSLDDAANLYARLPTARGTTLQVLRAGKPVTLRVSIQ
jgi:PDZ domain